MVKCNHCNTENDEDATHCQNCGKKITPKKGYKYMSKKIWIGLGIVVILAVLGALLFFTYSSEDSGLPSFDKSLLNSVKNGESSETLVAKIKDYSELNKQNSKTAYDTLISGDKSDNSSAFQSQAKTNYDKELDYIQKIENVQMQFANREIDEKTFIKEIKQVYALKPDMDY